jgi:hypothetical protein
MKIFRIAQVMNIKTNPEGVKSAFRIFENEDIEKSHGWKDWIHFLELENSDLPESVLEEMREGVVATIYGQGGWHRYYILGNGDVVFSRNHAMEEDLEKVEKAGFLNSRLRYCKTGLRK